jgi:hypothetical protein
MRSPFICAAGVELSTGRHVRPVLGNRQQLNAALLARNGGPFEIAVRVDLGEVTPAGSPPETEDYRFAPEQTTVLDEVPPAEFWRLLNELAEVRLARLFGPDLTKRGTSAAAVDVGRGAASLGCLVPAGRPQLYVRPRAGRPAQVRLRVSDGELDLDLGVTDIRLYADKHVTPDAQTVDRVARRLSAGEPVILSVGLTRAAASSADFAPVHWLQVNNIHLESDPAWRLR